MFLENDSIDALYIGIKGCCASFLCLLADQKEGVHKISIGRLDNEHIPATTEDSQKSKQFQLSLRSDFNRFQSKTQFHSDRARSLLAALGEELEVKAASLKSNEE